MLGSKDMTMFVELELMFWRRSLLFLQLSLTRNLQLQFLRRRRKLSKRVKQLAIRIYKRMVQSQRMTLRYLRPRQAQRQLSSQS
jgi:hypothetical protein